MSSPRAAIAPIHTAAPTRCKNIDEIASSWLVVPAAWPVWDCRTRATTAIAVVQAAPVGVATARANALVTAATTVTQSKVRPSEMSLTKTPSSAPNVSPPIGRPATLA